MQRLLIVVLMLICFPQGALADHTNTAEHRLEINRLSQLLSAWTFESIETVVEGDSLSEALSKAVEIISDHIDLESFSYEISTHDTPFVPSEQIALLGKWGYTLTETTSGKSKKVTLVIRLENQQLKQFALFEMWPLFGQEFVQKVST